MQNLCRNSMCLTLFGLAIVAGPLAQAPNLIAQEDIDVRAEPEAGTFREQTIYVPYEKLRQTFEKHGRGVFLPYEKFLELWNAARDRHPTATEDRPPVTALITEVDNEAVVADDVMRVAAKININLLAEGWIQVPLGLADAAVLSATIDGQPARLIPGSTGEQILLVKNSSSQPTEIELQLEYAKSLTKSPGRNSVEVAAPRAPVNRWRLRIPEAGVKVNVTPLLAASEVPLVNGAGGEDGDADASDDASQEGANDGDPNEDAAAAENRVNKGPESAPADKAAADAETIILAFVGATPTVRFDWTPRTMGATGLDALVSVQARQRTIIDQGVARTTTWLDYQISRSELSELRIRVPGNQKVVNVIDANVRQWDVQPADGDQLVIVRLFEPASQRQSIAVEVERFHGDGENVVIDVPVVAALRVGRQRGQVVVRLASGLRAEATERTGLSQLDTNEIAPQLANQKWDFAYRYSALPYQLQLAVEEIQPRITVDQLVRSYIEPQKMTMQMRAKYNIERAGVFELRVNLPSEYEVRSVRGIVEEGTQAAAVESYTTVDGQDTAPRQLVVNLSSKAQGVVGLFVGLERRLQDANLLSPTGVSSDISIEPLHVVPAGLENSTGSLVVYAPESLRITASDVTALRAIGVDEALQGLDPVGENRFPQMRPVLSFAFGDAAPTLGVTAERRKPQVTVHQSLVARIEPGVIKYSATLFYNIRYSGVKTLRVDLPAVLADSIRNVSPALRETVLDPVPDGSPEDYIAWELRGESELIGQQQLDLRWETPIEDFGVGQSVDLSVPRIIPQDVDRAEGQIIVAKDESIEVMPKGEPVGLDPIDPQHDLRNNVRVPDAAQALEFHNDWELTLTATRYQPEVLKHTSIEHALLRMVITRSDRVAVQALYRMTSNQQRLGVTLPREVAAGQIEFDNDPLRINGRPVPLERGDDTQTFFVPLVGQAPETPFLLELRFTMPGDGSQLECPHFPAKSDIQPAVQKVDLWAYVPRERRVIGVQGPWTNESHMSILDSPGQHRSAPTEKSVLQRLSRNISVAGNPLGDFQVDGRVYKFSTLRPDPPEEGGSLQLTTANSNAIQSSIFVVTILLGMWLIRRGWTNRIVWLLSVVAVLVLVGIFLPSLALVVLDAPLLWAAVLAGLLWLIFDVARFLPKLRDYRIRIPKRKPTPQPETADTPAKAPDLPESSGAEGTESEKSKSDADSTQGGVDND